MSRRPASSPAAAALEAEQLRSLVEQNPVAMLVQRAGRILYANPAAVRLFAGATAADLLERRIVELCHPAERDWLDPGSMASAAEPPSSPLFCRMCRIDGGALDVLVSRQAVDYAGAPAWLFSCQDVTAQRRDEAQLRDQTRFLQTLIDTIPTPIFYKDASGVYRGCNLAFVRMLGMEREDVLGKTTADVNPTELALVHQEADRKLLAHGGRHVYEADILHADGQLHRMVLHKAVFAADGALHGGLVGAMIDISERLRFEQALRRSEQNYRELSAEFKVILEGIPDSLTLWNDDRRVAWTNHNARKFYLIDAERVIGKRCAEICMLTHDVDGCVVQACFASGEQQDLVSRAQNGRTWSLKAFPIRDEQGRVAKVLSLATDITESLRLREEARRSAHLAALGELAAGIAHEINNPTGLILLNMPLVQDVVRDLLPLLSEGDRLPAGCRPGGLSPARLAGDLPEVIEEVIDGARRIKHIVEDLKDFSRIQDATCFERIDLNEVVQRSLRLLNNAIRKATDNFVVDYAPDLPPVSGIAQRLEQVVVNIVLNACQALASRKDNITVAVYHDAEKQANCIRVWDEGCGIDPAVLTQVTDPFFTTKREQGGTGLGLSVSSRIVDEHKGHLYIDSPPGQGTIVTLELPVTDQELS